MLTWSTVSNVSAVKDMLSYQLRVWFWVVCRSRRLSWGFREPIVSMEASRNCVQAPREWPVEICPRGSCTFFFFRIILQRPMTLCREKFVVSIEVFLEQRAHLQARLRSWVLIQRTKKWLEWQDSVALFFPVYLLQMYSLRVFYFNPVVFASSCHVFYVLFSF